MEINATAASLLGFLHRGPMTGWDLAQAVAGSIGYFWNVTRSQVYRELRALAAAGLVAEGETGRRDRRPYTITPAGRAAFAVWIGREPGPELIRFPLLLTLFFGAHLPPDRLDLFLKMHRLRHQQRLAQYGEIRARLARGADFAALTLDFGIEYERAVLRWFDTLPGLRRQGPTAAEPWSAEPPPSP